MIKAIRNILLLYPPTSKETYWSFTHALGLIGKKANTPPLGLLTVAAMLPDTEFNLRLVDMNVSPLTEEDLGWADAVFLSAMIAHQPFLEGVITKIKEAGKLLVAGGPHVSSSYRSCHGINTFMIGEAETVWPQFLNDLRNHTLKPAYAAPVRDEEATSLRQYFGEAAYIVKADQYPDINLAPVPRYDLLNMRDYALMPVQASRGCPVGCEFCDIWRRFGRKTRNKLTEKLLAELDELYRLGWRDTVFIVDDNFIGNRARAKAMLSDLKLWQEEHGWPFPLLTEATLTMADDEELLDLMVDAGFTSVFIGIETPSAASLQETRKHINTTGSMADKVATIQGRGIQIMAGFIIGFDADPDDIAAKMTECIQQLGIPQAMIGLLTALPDTDLHDRLTREGRIRFLSTGNNTHGFEVNFETVRPVARVVEDYKQILDAAYPRSMKAYFERCATLRSRWPSTSTRKMGQVPLGWKLKAFVRYVIAAAGSAYGFNAFRFILSTLVRKPSYFEEALTLSVKGHHLWKITRSAMELESIRSSLSGLQEGYCRFLERKTQEWTQAISALMPDYQTAGREIQELWTGLMESAPVNMASDEGKKIYQVTETMLREADQYFVQIQQEARSMQKALSREVRAVLETEIDTFLHEAETMYNGWKTALTMGTEQAT